MRLDVSRPDPPVRENQTEPITEMKPKGQSDISRRPVRGEVIHGLPRELSNGSLAAHE